MQVGVEALKRLIAADQIRKLADKLGRCLLCGSCQAACPPGVKIMEVFMEARELVNAYIGLHPVKKMVFRTPAGQARSVQLRHAAWARPCRA